tara:strand:- start:309 stop:554 length:246 start_codon:yes stop_codon:yes gene_type:complete
MLKDKIIKIFKTSNDIGSDLMLVDLDEDEDFIEDNSNIEDEDSEFIIINLIELQSLVDPDSVTGNVDIDFIGWEKNDEEST